MPDAEGSWMNSVLRRVPQSESSESRNREFPPEQQSAETDGEHQQNLTTSYAFQARSVRFYLQ